MEKNYNSQKAILEFSIAHAQATPLYSDLTGVFFSRVRSKSSRLRPRYYTDPELVAGPPVTSGSDGTLLFALDHSGKNRVPGTSGKAHPTFVPLHTVGFPWLLSARGLGPGGASDALLGNP